VGHRPATLALSVPVGVVDLGDVVLVDGYSLSGWIETPPTEELVDQGAILLEVSSAPTSRDRFTWGGLVVEWQQDLLEHAVVVVSTGSDGSFEIHGLRRGTYDLKYGGLKEGGCRLRGAAYTQYQVQAPTAGLVVQIQEPLLLLRFVASGERHIERVKVEVQGQGVNCYANEDSTLLLATPSAAYLRLLIISPGFESHSVDLAGPEIGQVLEYTVTLQELVDPAEIVLSIEPRGIERIGVHLGQVVDGQIVGNLSRILNIESDGTFHLPDLRSADYWIEISPDLWGESNVFYTGTSLRVTAEPGELVSKRIALEEGGRLAVRITDEEGTLLPARCTISDAAGRPLSVEFVSIDYANNSVYRAAEVPHQAKDVPGYAIVTPALPEGNYSIRAALEGYGGLDRSVSISKRQTCEEALVLKPN
jgi:hypothetical protein